MDISIMDTGATGEGQADNTGAIQQILVTCAHAVGLIFLKNEVAVADFHHTGRNHLRKAAFSFATRTRSLKSSSEGLCRSPVAIRMR